MAAVSPTINCPQPSPADEVSTSDRAEGPRIRRPSELQPAAVLFTRIQDDLDRLAQLVVGLDMAAADVANEPEEGGLRAIIGVVDEKIAALRTAMEEARDTLASEQKGETP